MFCLRVLLKANLCDKSVFREDAQRKVVRYIVTVHIQPQPHHLVLDDQSAPSVHGFK